MSGLYDETLQRLVEYRQVRNMTQIDMENQFGVAQSHYSKMELGRSEIPYDFLCKLYDNRWDVDYLVTGLVYGGRDCTLDSLVGSCRREKRNELMKLMLWGIEQTVDVTGDEVLALESRIIRMLLEQEPVSSIMYAVRNVKDFSQANMAERLGVGMRKYRRMEKGDTQPDLELLTMVYQISSCRPSLFLSGDEGKMLILNSLWGCIDMNIQQKLLRFFRHGIKIMGLRRK